MKDDITYIEEDRGPTRPPKRIPVVKCGCGRKVECHDFTNTCDCGADYNFGGQRLAPREQWGEETGEHWSDCY
jgi:hypothetical protein